MARPATPVLVLFVAAGLLAGCGGDDPAVDADQSPLLVTARDETGDVAQVPNGPADQERLDIDRVTVERDGPRLRVTFDTVEQPGEEQVRRLYAWSPSGDRTSVIEAVAGEAGEVRGYHTAPGGPRRRVPASQSGSLVTVTARLDAVTAAESFRWQARTLETRLDTAVADRVPDSGRARFPSAG